MIKNVDINLIENHPLNPRKNLGDLEELVSSIKESGILQNLTIVKQPEDDEKYWTVIGNRRLAAAKKAGLKEVPCSISDMDHKTQLATMLLENMQRVDLTAFEQAMGFQMMMDVGESVKAIAEKTGFSETTVRSRVKLLELDKYTLEEASKREPNLTDFIALEKIKDIEIRNEVLKDIGTSNFNNTLEGALRDQEREQIKDEMINLLKKTGAVEITQEALADKSYEGIITINDEGIAKIKESDGIEFYQVATWGISLYKAYKEAELTDKELQKRKEKEEKRKEEEKRNTLVSEIKSRTAKLRKDFLDSLSETKIKNHFNFIAQLIFETGASFSLWGNGPKDILGVEEDEVSEISFSKPYTSLLKVLYLEKMVYISYFNYRNEYEEDRRLNILYEFMKALGYQMSEEEKQLQDGTHELFIKGEN